MEREEKEKALRYVVTASMPSAVAEEYTAWLADGHLQAVVSGGASWAEVAHIDAASSDTEKRVASSYGFPSRSAYEKYVATVAPVLRAEGVQLFGPESGKGASFSRTLGELLLRCDSVT